MNALRFTAAGAMALLLSSAALTGSARAQEMPSEYQQVLDTLGKKGDYKGGVFKANIPRNDLKVTVDGVAVPTSFGFGGWVAMTRARGGMDVMMGDLVLLQEEVNPVMSALLDNGLDATAVHNHFFFEQPRIFYMHVHGMGTPADLARRVKPALDLIGHVPTRSALGAQPPVRAHAHRPVALAQGSIDTGRLDQIIGRKGEPQAGGVYKYTVGRDDLRVRHMGATIGTRMGLNTWAAFYGPENDAVVAGDVAMLQDEVTPVLKALRSNGLDVVAIHHHMTDTNPMIIFLHYWGRGPADRLATGFRAALDQLGKGGTRMYHHIRPSNSGLYSARPPLP